MATVHSLVCWGGRTGKTVTLTIASPCVVTSTNHGLRDGTGLVFSTTGALPTGITAGTTYYTRYVAANTFHLYDTEAHAKDTASTTGRINTSGTQSGTHTAKSRLMLDYFDQYPGRWGAVGSERCYDSIVSWHSARAGAGVSSLDSEVCELGQAFVDVRVDATTPTVSIVAATVEIASRINGARTEAFHYGQRNAGYELLRNQYGYNLLNIVTPRTTIDGFSITAFSTYYGNQAVNITGWGSSTRNMIIAPGTDTGTTDGVYLASSVTSVVNCFITGCLHGVRISNYTPGILVANNTFTGNATGVYPAAATNIYGEFYNNISIGNTTNWGAITYNAEMSCAGNAGLAGEAWYTGSNPQITIATTDFVNFPTDMRPALSTSPQVDSGVEYYGIASTDLADAERPNYNNGGVEAFDIGCYEFDHGYGDHPATSHISLTNIVSGSRVLITRDDTSAVLYNDVPGASLNLETGYIGNFTVRIRKGSTSPVYREFTAGGTTVADQTTSIKVLQQLDE